MSAPALRFKQDDGQAFPEWNLKQLGSIATFSKGKGISKADIDANGTTLCIRYGELYTEYGETIREVKSKTSVAEKNLVLSEVNDVIIPASGETQIDIATASCVQVSGVALGGDLNIIKCAENGVFLSYYLNSQKKLDIAKLAQGNSVVHLYSSQLKLLDINLPTKKEQSKIANFLTAVDEKITQLTQKSELLAQYKKGVMQKIFSQELRFKNDDGREFPEWEEAGFDDLFYVANNKKTQIKSSDYLEHGKTPIVDQGQKRIVGYTNNPEVYEDVPVIIFGDHTRILKWIDFAFASGADGTQVLKTTDKLNFKFGYFALCNIELPNLGYSRHMKELKEQFFMIPTSIAEQTKIANFLSTIDDKITQTQAELDAVKQYKQGLLQQMFV